MYKFITNIPEIQNDAEDIIRLFEPEYKRGAESFTGTVEHVFETDGKTAQNKIYINGAEKTADIFTPDGAEKAVYKRKLLKSVKTALYRALSAHSGLMMPYGSLTGIRPAKFARTLIKDGISKKDISAYLAEQYFIRRDKADLIAAVIENQDKYYCNNADEVDLYINIPFCPTRCKYCSFISMDYKSSFGILPEYLKTLAYEISKIKEIINSRGDKVRAVYIGGGTPTVLSAEQLDGLLDILPRAAEFTVEAGRPDTITNEKLRVMSERGVTRISVNPQTFNDNILKNIGRGHTAADITAAYELCRGYNFNINMDIIAGLSGEDYPSFINTVERVIKLRPDNITVHTLSAKKSADTAISDTGNGGEAAKMIEYSHGSLRQNGYAPYYMYRQKYMSGNLENTGYCTDGAQCLFNIDTMEENVSVIACGANAITKIYYDETNRIERAANVKNIGEYIERIDEMIGRKKKLLI